MNLPKLAKLVEQLRKNIIGEPVWIEKNGGFGYINQNIEVVTLLKLSRAVQGIKSQIILCNAGLFIDTFSLYRCVNDCTEEIHFLLEKYPSQSEQVKKFVKNFFENNFDTTLSTKTNSVEKKKIHSANVRYLTKKEQDEEVKKKLELVHKTFCGYIHANYFHIMETYGGTEPHLSFNLLGVPDENQKSMKLEIVKHSYISVLLCTALICTHFKEYQIRNEINNLIEEIDP